MQIAKPFAQKVLSFQGCALIKDLDIRGSSVAYMSCKESLVKFLGWPFLHRVPSTIHFISHR